MPKTNDVDVFWHVTNEGFADEYNAGGTASVSKGHTHQTRRSALDVLENRTFSGTAAVFGPLAAGDWEAVFVTNTNPGAAFNTVPIAFLISNGWNLAVATVDQPVPLTTGLTVSGGTSLGWFRFSLTPEKRFISFVAMAALTLRVSLRLLRQR